MPRIVICERCHRERPHRAFGMCDSCYKTATGGSARRAARRRERIKKQVFDLLGNKCVCCGEDESAFLTVDHINNDGADHRRRLTGDQHGGTLQVYADILKDVDYRSKYQLLCANCNLAKERLGYCPHHVPEEVQNEEK